MKLELFYDPVRPETTVRIDGLVTDTSDIYGFLYPVRNCLIQTYLYPNGSWTGLKHQIKELSRGEKVEFIFYGREIDYIDVKSALNSLSELTSSFVAWNYERSLEKTFDKLDGQLKKIFTDNNVSDDGIYRKSGKELFPDFFEAVSEIQSKPMSDWKLEINNREDFLKADQNPGCCCVVRDSFFESYDSFNSLEYLLRSMRRAPEMIICCFDSKNRLEDFSYYARQFDNLNFSLDTADNKSRQKEIFEKYGKPFLMRERFNGYARINDILNGLAKKKKELSEEKKGIEKDSSVSAKEIRKAEQCRAKINWINRKEAYFKEFHNLIETDFSEALSMKGDV